MQAVADAALANLTVDELLGELLERLRAALEADTCASPARASRARPLASGSAWRSRKLGGALSYENAEPHGARFVLVLPQPDGAP